MSRDFIDVNVLINTMVKALYQEKAKNQIFHLSSGREVDISKVAEICISELRNNHSTSIVRRGRRSGEVLRNFSDNSKAKNLLGHDTNFDSIESIKNAVKWLLSNVER